MAYKYYQPNNKGKASDCVIRALCKALGKSWIEVFKELIPYAEAEQDMPTAPAVFTKYIEASGGVWHGIKAEKGRKRMTVKELAKHTKGVHIAKVAHHVVCIIDGDWFDTFDCGNKPIYGHWEM